MTDMATALASAKLSTFEGQDVVRATIAVTNAGDGLSEAMKVDPRDFHLGDRVYVVLEAEVTKIRHEAVKDTDVLSRVHVLRAEGATIVDEDLVREHLDRQADRIRQAQEDAAGIRRIPFDEKAMEAQHDLGEHADGLVEGCPGCDEEQAALDAEGGSG